MSSILNKFLRCIRIAYWYRYSEGLSKEEGYHPVPFTLVTGCMWIFQVGLVHLIDWTTNESIPQFLLDIDISIILFLISGGVCTYIICCKNSNYRSAKRYLEGFPIEEQKRMGVRCGVLTTLLGFFPILLFLLVASIFGKPVNILDL